jgi:hypothetical protein
MRSVGRMAWIAVWAWLCQAAVGHARLGPRHPPIPGVHNSGWVQSPGGAGYSM